MSRVIFRGLLLACIALGAGKELLAQVSGPIVGDPVKPTVSKPLRELAAEAEKAKADGQADEAVGQVETFLKEKHPAAAAAQLSKLDDEVLQKAFPKAVFVALRFRQFPVARVVPEGWSAGNVCVLLEKEIAVIKDDKSLQAFLRDNTPAAMSDDDRDSTVKACLRLAEELYNDGFYRFEPVSKAKTTIAEREASGQIQVDAAGGNKGHIGVQLKFDDKGNVASAKTLSELSPGIRPICQSTKLLDADPIVRQMARRDLLVMGSSSLEYLLEQRAKASPELQQEMDAVWDQILAEGR